MVQFARSEMGHRFATALVGLTAGLLMAITSVSAHADSAPMSYAPKPQAPARPAAPPAPTEHAPAAPAAVTHERVSRAEPCHCHVARPRPVVHHKVCRTTVRRHLAVHRRIEVREKVIYREIVREVVQPAPPPVVIVAVPCPQPPQTQNPADYSSSVQNGYLVWPSRR